MRRPLVDLPLETRRHKGGACSPGRPADAAHRNQIPQFWYNAIKYASGDAACFNVTSPPIVP
jgi:hypothetical protein